ncbi:MAG: Outer rane porin protein 32 [Burkholderiaceae bacterium]|nr:Outer rane porin protein 32 [Burkholderiaceae bacterium]
MKKTLVALAVLGSFAGVASAATSVTLYGTVDAGYEGWTFGKDASGWDNTFVQGGTSEKNSKIGVRGQEDLGNGLAAIFTLEGNLGADVGETNAGQLFNRETTVGLKGSFGEVKIGRAKSQMELALGGIVPGHRVADVDLYSVALARHSNGLFYSYDNAGFSFGADVTTKGGAAGNSQSTFVDTVTGSSTGNGIMATFGAEGATGEKVGYGVRLGYAGQVGGGVTLLARAAYQNDGNVTATPYALGVPGASVVRKQREAGGLLAAVIPFSNNSLTVGVAYAQGKGFASDLADAKLAAGRVYADKARTLSAVVAGGFGSNDSAYVKYQQRKGTTAGATVYNGNVWAVGYEHNLSKRTSVYADVAYATIKNTGGDYNKATATGYSVGVAHSF